MEFIGLKLAGVFLYTVIVWYIGKRWQQFNSLSDVAARFNEAKDAVSHELVRLDQIAKETQAKADELKKLVP